MRKTEETFDKHYKKLLILPLVLILLSLSYVAYFYVQNGDIAYKDVTLTGGTTITLFTQIESDVISSGLSSDFSDIEISTISDNSGKQLALLITVSDENPENLKTALEEFIGEKLTEENSSIEYTGETLGKGFYSQLGKAILFAFLLMALVVFSVFGESKKIKMYSIILTSLVARLTFPINNMVSIFAFISAVVAFFYGLSLSGDKKHYIYLCLAFLSFLVFFFFPIYYMVLFFGAIILAMYTVNSIPSIAIVLSAFADILIPLAIIDFFGIKISSAGIVAFLMLIGYSVDTDILLTSRVLKRGSDSVNKAIWEAFKTGITMTLTSIVAVSAAFFVVYRFESILNQIFLIILLGLAFDLMNTWITNTCIIKWYAEKKK